MSLFDSYSELNQFNSPSYVSPSIQQPDNGRIGNASVALRHGRRRFHSSVSRKIQPCDTNQLQENDEDVRLQATERPRSDEPGSTIRSRSTTMDSGKKTPSRYDVSTNVNYSLFEQFKRDNPQMFQAEYSTPISLSQNKRSKASAINESIQSATLDKFVKAKQDLHNFKSQEVIKLSDYEDQFQDDLLHSYCQTGVSMIENIESDIISESVQNIVDNHQVIKLIGENRSDIPADEKILNNASKYNTLIPTIQLVTQSPELVCSNEFKKKVENDEDINTKDKPFVSDLPGIMTDCYNSLMAPSGICSDDSFGTISVFKDFLTKYLFSGHGFTFDDSCVDISVFINLCRKYEKICQKSFDFPGTIFENSLGFSTITGIPCNTIMGCLCLCIYHDQFVTEKNLRVLSVADLLCNLLSNRQVDLNSVRKLLEVHKNSLHMTVLDLLNVFNFCYFDRKRIFRLVYYLDYCVNKFFFLRRNSLS